MKIGIVTCYYANNFGAVLQAYGLKNVLENMGHEVYYIRTCSNKYARGMFFRIRPYGAEYFRLWQFIKKNFWGWKQKKMFLPVQEKFCVIDKWTDGMFDLVILGSDEIWNASNPLFRQAIFYGVGMKHVMSYAVSIGNATQDDMEKIPSDFFKDICPVLVRDSVTERYMSSIGIKSEQVCDPTILAGVETFEYPYYNRKVEISSYLLVYAYGHLETQQVKDAIRTFAKQRKLQVFSVCFQLDWCDGFINCSPLEFCEVIKHATYVYTSTFHGTIFAMLNQKQFVSLPYSIKTKDLLYSLELEDRLINLENCTAEMLVEKLIKETIDYERVNNIINTQRKRSLRLLLDGINRYNDDKTNN